MTYSVQLPVYMFGDRMGPLHPWFAWYPVRLWYGRWAWLRTISRVRIVKHAYLQGPDWEFWCYADIPAVRPAAPATGETE